MYHLRATTGEVTAERVGIIEDVTKGSKHDLPFARDQLIGDISVLGYYYTQQPFVARTALAVFPSLETPGEPQVVVGSFCDWRKPDAARLLTLPLRLVPCAFKPLARKVHGGYLQWARSIGALPKEELAEPSELDELEAICAAEGWPSAVFTLETVENDSPENPKPELATLWLPMIASAYLSLASLRNAVRSIDLSVNDV